MVSAAMRNQTLKSRRAAEESLLGGMALALLAAACIWLVLGPAPAVCGYLISAVLLVALLLPSFIMMHPAGSTPKKKEAPTEAQRPDQPRAITVRHHDHDDRKE